VIRSPNFAPNVPRTLPRSYAMRVAISNRRQGRKPSLP
jgi:hypothetical protein